MPELQRVTTEYIDTEDRIRLTGEVSEGQSVVIWLTQRLLTRLLPHLFLWLEQQNGSNLPVEIVQSFAQQAARAELSEQAPVRHSAESAEWLVYAVDITPHDGSLRMRFRSTGNDQASLSLQLVQLRQWLGIVHLLWSKGGWPMGVWPAWIGGDIASRTQSTAIHLH